MTATASNARTGIQRTAMKALAQNLAAFAIVAVLFLMILWIAGYNFDGTWDDPFTWDHPENFTHAQ